MENTLTVLETTMNMDEFMEPLVFSSKPVAVREYRLYF